MRDPADQLIEARNPPVVPYAVARGHRQDHKYGGTPRIDAAEVLQATEQLGGVCRYIASISAAYVGANRPPLVWRRLHPDGLEARPRVRRQVRGRYLPCWVLGDCR